MKIRTFFMLLLLGTGFFASAQVAPIAQLTVQGGGKAIFIHDFTGIPIVQTNETYTAINPIDHTQLWAVDRNKTTAALESVGGEGTDDYVDFFNTPFAFFNGSILNVLTGQVLVDGEKEEIKSFSTFYIIPAAELVLVELYAKGKIRLYGLDPFTSEMKWGVDLREMSGLGQVVASAETSGAAPYVIPPLLTANGDLLYHNDKYLASVDLKSGQLKWNNKLDPGYIFQNDDATKLLVAEKRGGLGGMMTLPTDGGAPNKFSKTLYLLDADTGESLWSKGDSKMDGNIEFIMPYDDGYIVVHDAGFNIFDYTPGKSAEGRWKKDYAEKDVRDIVVEDEGLMVYFKNRRVLIDPATGEDIWKKAEKLDKEPSAYLMAWRSRRTQVGDHYFYTQGGNIYVNAGKGTSSYPYDAYDYDADSKLLVITNYDETNGASIKVGPWTHSARAINMETGANKRTTYGIRKEVESVDKVANGYFFYNDRGFALLNFDGNDWSEVTWKYYPDPSRGERFLKGAVMSVALAGAQVRNGLGGSSAVISNDDAAIGRYEARQSALDSGNDVANEMVKRRRVGRVENDFGYFFAGNDDNQLVLFKVDKNTGEEVKQYPFDDNQPVYEIDSAYGQLYYLVDDQLKIFAL